MRRGTPRLLQTQGSRKRSLGATKLLQDGFEVPIFRQDRVSEHLSEQGPKNSPVRKETQSKVVVKVIEVDIDVNNWFIF